MEPQLNSSLYEQIAVVLREKIRSGEITEGEFIPSISELRDRFHVSHITILRVYRELVRCGIIEKHGRRYRAAAPKLSADSFDALQRSCTIGVFLRPLRKHERDNFFNDINLALEEAMVINRMDSLRSFAVSLLYYPAFSLPENFMEIARRLQVMCNSCRGVLVDERVSDEVLSQVLKKTSIPLVLVNRESELPISCVVADNHAAVRQVCTQALRLNYRRIIFVGDNYDTPYWNNRQRADAFDALSDEFAEKVEMVNCKDETGNIDDQIKKIIQMLQGKGTIRTLVFVYYDIVAVILAERLLEAGLETPRDYGLCGFLGCDTVCPGGKHLTTVRIDASMIGRQSIRLLMDQINYAWDKRVEKIKTSFEFILGDTM